MSDSETDSPSIKALIVFRENGETDNLFVPILCDAIRMAGINVRYSQKEFWESDTTYDIIHFQWPEELVGWTCKDPDVIESESDTVVHMGHYSQTEFIQKYPDSRNVIIPYHIYQYTYKEDISIERARQYLNLPQEAFVVTAFGKFRNREERRMLLGAFRDWDKERKLLIAPRLCPFSRRNNYGRNILKRWASRIGYYVLMPLLNRMFRLQAGANDEPIDECDLPYYMSASDVIFIQERNALNSVNIPLAFLFHKIVVGPNTGNIGELLKNTGNPTFNPNHKADIIRALKMAWQLSTWGKGEMNYTYALENMSIDKVGKQYAEVYRDLNSRL